MDHIRCHTDILERLPVLWPEVKGVPIVTLAVLEHADGEDFPGKYGMRFGLPNLPHAVDKQSNQQFQAPFASAHKLET